MDTIEQRLSRLEVSLQRSRRMNRMLVFAVVALAGVASSQVTTSQTSDAKQGRTALDKVGRQGDVASLQKGDARTIEADQLVLLDSAGRSRVRIGVADDGPAISMFDETGQKCLELGCTTVATGLRLSNPQQSSIASLQLPSGGGAQLQIQESKGSSLVNADGFRVRDSSKQSRLQLALLNGNFPMLGISQSGQDGPPSIEVNAGEGTRSMKIHDERGQPLFSVIADNERGTSLTLRHPNEEKSLELSMGSKQAGGPRINLFAPAKQDGSGGVVPLLQFGLRDDNQGYLRIIDGDGRPRFAVP